LLYGTTAKFLEHFGLRDLDDMPKAAELRLQAAALKAVERPASPSTEVNGQDAGSTETNEGQATANPQQD
jgi:hypothetical protein